MTPYILAVANKELDVEMSIRHAQTALDLARFNSDANTSGIFGSCDHRLEVRAFCVAELHHRASRAVEVCLAAHATVCGTSDATTRNAVKEWLAQRLAREVNFFELSLIHPRTEYGENWPIPDLKEEAVAELRAAMVRVDDAFDALHRNRVERGRRAITRLFRRLPRFR